MSPDIPPPKQPAQVQASKKKDQAIKDMVKRLRQKREKRSGSLKTATETLEVKPFGPAEHMELVGKWKLKEDQSTGRGRLEDRVYQLVDSDCLTRLNFRHDPNTGALKKIDSIVKKNHDLSPSEVNQLEPILGARSNERLYKILSAQVSTIRNKQAILVTGLNKKSSDINNSIDRYEMLVLLPEKDYVHQISFSGSKEQYDTNLHLFKESLETIVWSWLDQKQRPSH